MADFRASLQEAMRLARMHGAQALIADNRLFGGKARELPNTCCYGAFLWSRL
jgi:hypothetical protein